MTPVNLDEIKRDLAAYLHRAQAGETFVVLDADQPLAEIKPLGHSLPNTNAPRPFGLCAGEFIVPDNFDAPLPEEARENCITARIICRASVTNTAKQRGTSLLGGG